MSLINSASIWNNDDDQNKKRIPTMRKTMKKMPTLEKNMEEQEESNNERPTTFMEEELSPAGFRKKLDKMPSEERQKLLQVLGKEETLKLLRSK